MKIDLEKFSNQLGWSIAGVCDVEASEEFKNQYRDWIENYKGPQLQYLERRMDERLDPKKYLKEAKSIICFGFYYFPGWAEGEVKVSNYAWGKDYHLILKEKLELSILELKKIFGDFHFRSAVDTSPIAEKYWAQKAGLGWQGKNTLLLNTNLGSMFFLAEIISSLDPDLFEESKPIKNHCGTCTRCLDACPTQALEAYRLIAERCISYLNLEHKGDFDENTPSLEGWVAGCDICQEVCPWNQKLIPVEIDPETKSFQNLKPADIESNAWTRRIQNRAISYVPRENWPRNLRQARKPKT